MWKNVAVFVDVANIFYAAKAAGVDIDYVTLLKSATAGRDFVRAYAYTGLDPDNENQRNFHQFLARHQLQGRQQGHPQVRRRQGQGEPRHRARRRPHEDRAQPRHRRDRVRRRGLCQRDPRRPGDGRPRRGRQLPRQHVVRPDRGRRPVHRHHPDRQGRQGLHPVRPPRRRGRRRGPVDDRGPGQDDRGHRARPWSRPWPRWPLRAGRGAGRGARPLAAACPMPRWGRRSPHRPPARSSRCRARSCRVPAPVPLPRAPRLGR